MSQTTNAQTPDEDAVPPYSFGKEFENKLRAYIEAHASEKFTEQVRARLNFTLDIFTPLLATPFGMVKGEPDPYSVGASSLLLGYILGREGMPIHPSETVDYILDKYYKDVEVDL